jgi:hypothetical protein
MPSNKRFFSLRIIFDAFFLAIALPSNRIYLSISKVFQTRIAFGIESPGSAAVALPDVSVLHRFECAADAFAYVMTGGNH